MATDATSLKSNSSSKPRTPGVETGKRVGFARPTLIIPPPQTHYPPQFSAYTPGGISNHSHHSHGYPPYAYGRKASMFMMHQFDGIKDFAKSGLGVGEKCSYWCYGKITGLSKKWFTHCFLSIVLSLYTVGGALLFMYVEGSHETKIVEHDLRTDRYNLIRNLRNLSISMPDKTSEGEWEGAAARMIFKYEDNIIAAYQKSQLILINRGNKIWTLWNAIVYCATVYTTLGYGHLYPSTTTGRALTIVYAIVGIPLFLIALTDFGKLFTRAIKFLWSFVRRLYYTGSCRKVRKSATASEIFKGAQMMYGIATFRRPSKDPSAESAASPFSTDITSIKPMSSHDTVISAMSEDTPTTPDLSTFEIDDEFNLPISVALFILVAYMFIGALVYCAWEGWEFFTSFYFVFISLSTIGFGDFIPAQPVVLIVSIVYLVFGLALMSMCINVVQVKLSDTFQQASIKLSSTMGFEMPDSGMTLNEDETDVVQVHKDVEKNEDEVKSEKIEVENNNSATVDKPESEKSQ
ncbi:TWiK family of potassium channels protein 18 isoform X2 [Diabrotica virgifera virgifera]|uniref:Potassium channel domain-containing protein n=1 Tax=Diabrotica virgifera virgifera TaxID=50390 RepID=A0ABM5JLX5_DIAVI|nr:TWiK family of potassium channels protein 18 isoform X2 [Diabrotica virgifera virgifera]